MPLTGQPFTTTQPWSVSSILEVMHDIIPDLEKESQEKVGVELLHQLVLFLHNLIGRVNEEIFEYPADHDVEMEGQETEMEVEEEEDTEETAEEAEAIKVMLSKIQNPAFLAWMSQFMDGISKVLNSKVTDITNLLGLDIQGLDLALKEGRSIYPYTTLCLKANAAAQFGELCADAYEQCFLQPDTKFLRPASAALELWKKGEKEKTEEDEEDEELIHSYIQTHPEEVLEMEKEEFGHIIERAVEAHSALINEFIGTYGPKYVELLVTRTLLPIVEQQELSGA